MQHQNLDFEKSIILEKEKIIEVKYITKIMKKQYIKKIIQKNLQKFIRQI